jgi:ribosomal protein S18 acetylase RimI-like enzyme
VTDSIRIAPLQPAHRPEIETIVRATGVFSDEEIAVALELFDEAALGDYEFLGAFSKDRLVGYACFGQTPSTDRTYDLYWIAVHPDAQRSGAGALLMNEVERQLEGRSARLLVVETSSRSDYAPTRRFYNKRGYDEAARLRDFYSPGDDRVVLTKRLHAVPVAGAGAGHGPLPDSSI